MAKEIKFNVKLTVDGKERLVTAALQSKRPTTGTVRLWVFCFIHTPFQGFGRIVLYTIPRFTAANIR